MLNKVQLIGNVGGNPEIRTTDNNVKVVTISVATTEFYKDKSGQKVSKTEWHSVVLWRSLAELAEKWIKKGSQIYVGGKLSTRSWEKDNVTHYKTEIIANELRFLNKPKDDAKPTTQEEIPSASEPVDDLPF